VCDVVGEVRDGVLCSGIEFEGFNLKQAQSLQQLAQQLAVETETLVNAIARSMQLVDNACVIWSTVGLLFTSTLDKC
jgi:hypothetical protein